MKVGDTLELIDSLMVGLPVHTRCEITKGPYFNDSKRAILVDVKWLDDMPFFIEKSIPLSKFKQVH